jgi:hypothetical protein
MSYYDFGSTDDLGALVVTPGAMKAEMETIDTGIRQLAGDIETSSARPKFKDDWRAFVAEWGQFYKRHGGWTDRLWGITYQKILDYRTRLDAWRSAFIREGGRPTAPSMPSPDGAGIPWSRFGWIALGITGMWAGVTVLRTIRRGA